MSLRVDGHLPRKLFQEEFNDIKFVLVVRRVDYGKLEEALKAYRDGLAIRERFAVADPSNAQWRRGLSVSYERIGGVLEAQGKLEEALEAYRDSLAIRGRLAAADRSNARWQSDLSVAYNRVGEMLVAQGKLAEALKAYRDGLAIRERLAAADRSNTEWQRNLSVSYDNVDIRGHRRGSGSHVSVAIRPKPRNLRNDVIAVHAADVRNGHLRPMHSVPVPINVR